MKRAQRISELSDSLKAAFSGQEYAPTFGCKERFVHCVYKLVCFRFSDIAYRQWGDKTLYLQNVKCSGDPKNMAVLTL